MRSTALRGDEGAEYRALARKIQGKASHSLNPTALVHEAYGRLVGAGAKPYEGSRHFMKVAVIAMRQFDGRTWPCLIVENKRIGAAQTRR